METAQLVRCFVIQAFLFHGLIPLPAKADERQTNHLYERNSNLDDVISAHTRNKLEGMPILKCLRWCLEFDWCRAAFFKEVGGICELTSTIHKAAVGLRHATGYVYYRWKYNCPVSRGYSFFPDHDLCIRIGREATVTQDRAIQQCAADGPEARLVQLDTDDKVSHFVQITESLLKDTPKLWRVAGAKVENTSYELPGGQQVASSIPWGDREPNGPHEMCLAFTYQWFGAVRFVDLPCSSYDVGGFICEYFLD